MVQALLGASARSALTGSFLPGRRHKLDRVFESPGVNSPRQRHLQRSELDPGLLPMRAHLAASLAGVASIVAAPDDAYQFMLEVVLDEAGLGVMSWSVGLDG